MFEDLTEKNDDIVGSIVDGSHAVETIEEFKEILQTDPENPSLLRTYGDFLVGSSMFDEAALVYKKSAGLFVKSGSIVKAIQSTILQWSVIKVADRECRSIYRALHEIKTEEVPSFNFFGRMTYSELIDVMGELEQVQIPSGRVLREPDDPENDIFFIVSGLLRETVNYHSTTGGVKQFTATLAENMFFGDIFPLEGENIAPSRVETITAVKMLKLSKPDMTRLCQKYPNIGLLLMELCQTRRGSESRRYSHLVRSTTRYQLQTKVTLEIFPNDKSQRTLILKCITDNVSEGGACINLGEKYWIGSAADLVGRNAKMMISVPKASLSFEVTGSIVWKKEVLHDEVTYILVGIQFNQISEEDFNFLKKYCYVGDGEQDMIYSLWESYVKK